MPTTTVGKPRPAYRTAAGRLFVGDAAAALAAPALRRWRGRVQLVFTSPPFPLCREKKYGNLRGEAYAEWLAAFAKPLAEFLTPDGSIVLELGNGWESGQPTVSLAAIKALIAFQEAAGLHLCQEFIGYNPARLPTPAEWVTVRRVRVKDSFTRLWWLSPTPHPKADNRRVLTEYSASMKRLLQRGTYNGGRRPSEHSVGHESFLSNNGGAIPPNVLVPRTTFPLIKDESPLFPPPLRGRAKAGGQRVNPSPTPPPQGEGQEEIPEATLVVANTGSNGAYQRACRAGQMKRHPARMPEGLAEFFVRFLTEPGDLVMDPFAGSNTTGAVAEALGRQWIGIERDEEYARCSQARFTPVPGTRAA